MTKCVLFQRTDTQRVTVQINDDQSVLVSKEWKKQQEDDWIVGKGIQFTADEALKLGEILSCCKTSPEKLDELLLQYEVIQGRDKT